MHVCIFACMFVCAQAETHAALDHHAALEAHRTQIHDRVVAGVSKVLYCKNFKKQENIAFPYYVLLKNCIFRQLQGKPIFGPQKF